METNTSKKDTFRLKVYRVILEKKVKHICDKKNIPVTNVETRSVIFKNSSNSLTPLKFVAIVDRKRT